MHQGSCICKKVTFEINCKMPDVHACHCTICRKASGHFGVGADVPRESLTVHGEEFVKWYQSSDWARRGFCSECGTPLFFDPLDQEKIKWTGISMGAFDGKTDTKMIEHIFIKDKGDYYSIDDGLPQFETIPNQDS